MRNLLKTVFELAGFALVGILFFTWFLGNNKNRTYRSYHKEETTTLDASLEKNRLDGYDDVSSFKAKKFDGDAKYERKKGYSVASSRFKSLDEEEEPERYQKKRTISQSKKVVSAVETPAREARIVKSWKGVHRNKSYAWRCEERFGDVVNSLSAQYGLFPEVFMARIIAYSYEFVQDPWENPSDNNITAMQRPDGRGRAKFRSSEESLKAYAVVNAGEVNQFSLEEALAKHDRAWTMKRIISNNGFEQPQRGTVRGVAKYDGHVGRANKISSEEEYRRTFKGEAIRILSLTDKKVKNRQAKDAGFDNWEEYMDDLPEERRIEREDRASAVSSARFKKKAFNAGRRVSAQRRRGH